MGLAKTLKRAPRQVAEAVVAKLDVADVCERVEIAGPGFINLTLKTDVPRDARRARSRATAGSACRPRRAATRWSSTTRRRTSRRRCTSATCARRSSATRSRRMLEFVGHEVVRQNHVGDWGTPFGMLIEHLLDLGQGETGGSDSDVGELSEFYRSGAREVRQRSRIRGARARSASCCCRRATRTRSSCGGSSIDISKRYFNAIYAQARRAAARRAPARRELLQRRCCPRSRPSSSASGLAQINDGALCVFPPGFTNREGEPLPLIVRKQDGGFGYARDGSRGAALPHADARRHAAAVRRRRAAGAALRDGVRGRRRWPAG